MMDHLGQKRMSFNYPGTQSYGDNNRLFLKQLEVCNDVFDKLPPPEPSQILPSYQQATARPIAMSAYNNSAGVCFAGTTRVLLAPSVDSRPGGNIVEDNLKTRTIAIQHLRPGMVVQTLRGTRQVKAVLKCSVNRKLGIPMRILPIAEDTSLWVTPGHPISLDDGRSWVYPAQAFPRDIYPQMTKVGFKEPVYSVQLSVKPTMTTRMRTRLTWRASGVPLWAMD